MKQIRMRLTYANVMSSLAVFLVLGGGAAVAANQLAKNTVGTPQLKKNAVKAPKIARNAVKAPKIAKDAVTRGKIAPGAVNASRLSANAVTAEKLLDGSVIGTKLADGAVTGPKVANGSLSSAKLSDVHVIPLTKIVSTSGANLEAARTAAPSVPLVSNGPISLYAKCMTDEGSSQSRLEVYAATTEPGSLMYSWSTWLLGNPYLDPDTPEAERRALSATANANDINGDETMILVAAPNGAQIHGQIIGTSKNGNPPKGNGIYGPGNVCLISGSLYT